MALLAVNGFAYDITTMIFKIQTSFLQPLLQMVTILSLTEDEEQLILQLSKAITPAELATLRQTIPCKTINVLTQPLEDLSGLEDEEMCAICLGPLNTSSLVTLLCCHRFHLECFGRYEEQSCPICRRGHIDASTRCEACGTSHNVWLCLECGYTGCGRAEWSIVDDRTQMLSSSASASASAPAHGASSSSGGRLGHALRHHLATSHPRSRQVEDGRVWDYVLDDFVDDASGEASGGKSSSLVLEYTHAMTSQLNDRRERFESELQRLRKQREQLKERLDRMRGSLQKEYEACSRALVDMTRRVSERSQLMLQLESRLSRARQQRDEELVFVQALESSQHLEDFGLEEGSDVREYSREQACASAASSSTSMESSRVVKLEAELSQLRERQSELLVRLTSA